MTALPSLDLSPFVIFVDPVGPTTPSFPNLTMAVERARQLEAASHRIQSIRNDTKILKGAKLRVLLGEPPERPSLFPRS
jgi:hypothetical protein